MKIQPYMIDVEYNFNGLLTNGTLPVIKVHLFDQLNYDAEQECWYTFNYYRGDIQKENGQIQPEMLQTGFKLVEGNPDDVTIYLASLDGKHKRKLHFDVTEEIWFELRHFGKKDGKYVEDHRDWVSGIVFAGEINIVIEATNETKVEKLVFLPSGISIRDYEAMLDDLKRIREDLISRSKTNVEVSAKLERTPYKIKEIVDAIEKPLRQINNQPAGELSFKWAYLKPDKSSRFHARTEIEKEIIPGKNKYRTFVNYETDHTYENRLIKQELSRLRAYCERYSSHAPLHYTDQEQKFNEMNTLYAKSNVKVHKLIGELDKADFKKGKAILAKNIETIEKQINLRKNQILNQLAPRTGRLLDGYQEVKTTISCSISAFQMINTNYSFEPYFKTFLESGWDQKNQEVHLKFNEYRYVLNGDGQIVPRPKSKFVRIHNFSKQLVDHWKLLKGIRLASVLLRDHPFGEVTMEISGQAVWRGIRNDPTDWNDIFGIPSNREGKNDYKFIFSSVEEIKVNGTKIEPETNDAQIKKELASFIEDLDPWLTRLYNKWDKGKMNFSVVNQLANLEGEKTEIIHNGELMDEVIQKLDCLLNLPLFRKIPLTTPLPLQPTQLFLHDPIYQQVWRLLQSLEDEVGISFLSLQNQRKIGVEKVHKIYETWCLFKVLHILTTNLGWELKDQQQVTACLSSYLENKRNSLDGFETSLYQKSWRIEFKYEPKVKKLEDGNRKFSRVEPGNCRPDYLFTLYKDNELIGNIYLDAKHKNFQEQGLQELTELVNDTAINNYGKMVPLNIEGKTLASFLVHSDIATGMNNETNGENYYSYYNREEFPKELEMADDHEAHKYGAIYMLPSAIHSFKNWFRMVMEFRVGIYRKCWMCGCEEVHFDMHYTEKGYPKYYLTCTNCHEFWVKVHCHTGDNIIKHPNNYHRQVFKDYSWYIVCPTCGDGFEIEDQINQEKQRKIDAALSDWEEVLPPW
ncbi:nuclease domain-containing protein [Neobacillus drentensis]|uniref:nuclease domain-containing protein n=1 Tax=Neobacillus drentensis TaxID=220684 RepID=UPI003002D29A